MTVPKKHHRTKEQVRAHKSVISMYENRIPSTDVMGRKMTSDWCRNLKVLHLVGVSSDSPVKKIKLLQYELQPGHAQQRFPTWPTNLYETHVSQRCGTLNP